MKRRPLALGFTLIEALVALLVMSFGMLGVLGIQAMLRQYSDLSKQRSEAVRLAQESMEGWRAFSQLGASAGADWADIVSDGPVDVTSSLPSATNATFMRQRIVTAAGPVVTDIPERGKWVQTRLSWVDRVNAPQQLDFVTHVSGISPELAGTLVVAPGGGSWSIAGTRGRHAGIPRAAVDDGTGKSIFSPPGMPGSTWTFDNTSGYITKVCNPTCTTTTFFGFVLSGYVRFSDPRGTPVSTLLQPSGADAENPSAPLGSSTFGPIGVSVTQTAPVAVAGTVVCAVDSLAPQFIAYYCAMPSTDPSVGWSGRSFLTDVTFAADAAETSPTVPRNCRYTPQTVEPAVPPLKNFEHPANYAGVTEALVNQNFLVIRAGDGTVAFTCPGDDSSTPFINGNTFRHQPAT